MNQNEVEQPDSMAATMDMDKTYRRVMVRIIPPVPDL